MKRRILNPRIVPDYPQWICADCPECNGVGQTWNGDLYDCKDCYSTGGYWVSVKTGRNHRCPNGRWAKGSHTREEIDKALSQCTNSKD